MRTIRLAAQFCIIGAMACRLYAEKVNLTPQQLRQTATHIIVGTVVAVYEHKETNKDWDRTNYVAEVRVQEAEKGAGIKKGDLVYVRYWRRAWIARELQTWQAITTSGVLDTHGHRGLPKSGETLRIYLARNAYDGFGVTSDGGFNVVGANGFEKPKD